MNPLEDLNYRTIDFVNHKGTLALISSNPLTLCYGNWDSEKCPRRKDDGRGGWSENCRLCSLWFSLRKRGPPQRKQWQAGRPGRPGESEALCGADSSFYQPPSNTCWFLLLCSIPWSSPAAPLAAYQVCPALTFKPVFLSVTFSHHSSSLFSLSLGLCILELELWHYVCCGDHSQWRHLQPDRWIQIMGLPFDSSLTSDRLLIPSRSRFLICKMNITIFSSQSCSDKPMKECMESAWIQYVVNKC